MTSGANLPRPGSNRVKYRDSLTLYNFPLSVIVIDYPLFTKYSPVWFGSQSCWLYLTSWIGLYDSERNQVEDEVRSSNLCEKFGIEIENGKVSSLNSLLKFLWLHGYISRKTWIAEWKVDSDRNMILKLSEFNNRLRQVSTDFGYSQSNKIFWKIGTIKSDKWYSI